MDLLILKIIFLPVSPWKRHEIKNGRIGVTIGEKQQKAAMASLHPGLLFNNPGFNRRSTPLKTDQGTHENDTAQNRLSCEGQLLLRPSPVSGIYDASNSSSRLILLNNKLFNRSRGSRLSSQTDYKGDISHPDPERHLSDSPRFSNYFHKKCAVSETKSFLPPVSSSISSSEAGKKDKQSSKKSYSKNQDSCHIDHDLIRLFESLKRPQRLPSGRPHRLSPSMSSLVSDATLRHGERHYLASIAQIYGVETMRQQNIQQYIRLMWKEISQGDYSVKDVNNYLRYLSRSQNASVVTRQTSATQRQPYSSPGKGRSKIKENPVQDRVHTSDSPRREPLKNKRKPRDLRARSSEGKRNGDSKTSKVQDSKVKEKKSLQYTKTKAKTYESTKQNKESPNHQDSEVDFKGSKKEGSKNADQTGRDQVTPEEINTQEHENRTQSFIENDAHSSSSDSDHCIDSDDDVKAKSKVHKEEEAETGFTEKTELDLGKESETNLESENGKENECEVPRENSLSEHETDPRSSESDKDIESKDEMNKELDINEDTGAKQFGFVKESEHETVSEKKSDNDEDGGTGVADYENHDSDGAENNNETEIPGKENHETIIVADDDKFENEKVDNENQETVKAEDHNLENPKENEVDDDKNHETYGKNDDKDVSYDEHHETKRKNDENYEDKVGYAENNENEIDDEKHQTQTEDDENHKTQVDNDENQHTQLDGDENHKTQVDDDENQHTQLDDDENHKTQEDDDKNQHTALDDDEKHKTLVDEHRDNQSEKGDVENTETDFFIDRHNETEILENSQAEVSHILKPAEGDLTESEDNKLNSQEVLPNADHIESETNPLDTTIPVEDNVNASREGELPEASQDETGMETNDVLNNCSPGDENHDEQNDSISDSSSSSINQKQDANAQKDTMA